MNRATFSGNLTRDPEWVDTKGGGLCRFTVAVNENRKVGDSWEERAHFVDVTYFGRRGELMVEKAGKGDKVYVDGRLDYATWEKDGETRSKLGIVANEVEGEFVFRKSGESRARSAQPELPAESADLTPDGDDDDDIPF